LRQAAAARQTTVVRELLKNDKINVNSQGAGSLRTALHWACVRGDAVVVALLLQVPHIQLLTDAEGNTPYQLVTSEHTDIKEMRTRHFKHIVSTIDVSDDEARLYHFNFSVDAMHTIAMCATAREMETLITQHKLEAPAFYVHGVPLLSWLAMKDMRLSSNGKVEALLRLVADPNATPHKVQHNFYGNTVLHSLLANEAIDETLKMLKIFQEKSAIPLNFFVRETKTQRTVVHFAAFVRSVSVLRCIADAFTRFIDTGATVLLSSALTRLINEQDVYANTALHYACLFGDVDTAELYANMGDDEIF
jgi:ankyrin repeat protein